MYPTIAASPSARSGAAFSLERAMASPHRLAEGSRANVGGVRPGKRCPNAERGYRPFLFDDGLRRHGGDVLDPGRCLQLAEESGIGLDIDGPAVQLKAQHWSSLGDGIGDRIGPGLEHRRG